MDETFNYFRRRREELKLTQREIAVALDVSSAAVGCWERDEASPPIGRADDLARVYETDWVNIVLQVATQANRINARKRGPLARVA